MNQNSQLECSLKDFATAVERLVENPLSEIATDEDLDEALGRALDATNGSGRVIDLLYAEKLRKRDDFLEYARQYKRLVRLCLKEIQEMMPRANGQAVHFDLYSQQMRGRLILIERACSNNYEDN